MKKITLFFAALTLSFSAMATDMSGTYLVGTGQTYTTLGAAITDVNAANIIGDITFEIMSDISETAPITLTATNGSYTITVKPGATITPTITFSGCVSTSGANQYSGFAVNNTSNIVLDGSNTTNGTTKDLTFKMNDATNGRNIIQLYGNCDNVSIKNMNVIFQSSMSTSTSTRAIYLNGQSTGACDNFIVENCNLGDASQTPYYGIGVTGSSGSAIYCTNVQIKNNNIFGRIRPVYLYYVGTSSTTTKISSNTIYSYGGANGSATYFIMYNTWAGTINIIGNKMPVLTTNNSTAQGIYGISGLSAAATGSPTVNLINNTIGGNIAATGSGTPTACALNYIQDNGTYNILNNTYYLPAVSKIKAPKACVYISGASAVVNLTNNILINKTDTANSYTIYKSANQTLTSDYNDLYVSGATASIGSVNGTIKTTLANWQSAGYDASSKSVAVTFTDEANGDLTLAGASVQDISLSVPLLTAVPTDMFGTVRSNPTYAGAHESTLPFIVTSNAQIEESIQLMRTANGIAINLDNESTVEIYSINGVRIEKAIASGLYTHDLNSGVYIVKINGKSQKFIK